MPMDPKRVCCYLSILASGMGKTYVIDAKAGLQIPARLKECWQRRDLIRMLGYRDIKVRYTQTLLGMVWAILNPVISVLLLVFVFHVIAGVDTEGVPAVLFTVSGLCAWNYFSKVLSEAGISIVGAQELVKKVYFPRLVIPVSKAISALIDLAVVLILLLILLWVYRYPVTAHFLFLFPFILLLIFVGLGCGIWVAALTVRFRDFHHIVPVLLRVGMFVSPIAYGTGIVPGKYVWIMGLNPLTGIMDGFRYALFQLPINSDVLWMSVMSGAAFGISGLYYFLHMEKYIADIV